MAIYQRGKFLRYRFRFAGKQIDESTKTTSKTIAREAERQHRRALEAGYNNFKELRENRVRVLQEIIDEYQDEATEEQSKSKAPMFGDTFPTS